MSDEVRKLLKQVVSGEQPPEKLLEAIKSHLSGDDAQPDAMRSVINAAEQLGVDKAVVREARTLVGDEPAGEEKTSFNVGEPTRAVPDDGDRTEMFNPDATRKDIGEPTAMADDDATVAMGDEDKTTAIDPDRTIAVDDDRTVAADDDRTAAVAGDDPFSMTDSTVAPSSKGGGTDQGPGSVLKGRFRLESVIGQGGMGAVYKAVDLLKIEARDRNPYIAVKLLVGDFKEHPEAFIALQRESTKAQRLAHPNIATVYDFDRDGETVYMTMELMEGMELAKYIKKLPAGGLPVEEANKIIEQLCAGLTYAHARNLVHSDFKPGNAFLLDDGTVKLLDFGIARASSTKADAEGEQTVFDPGELGALTPAYATIDMFEGKDPDPRDDIYALACVTYELYTGQHPFKKQSAVKARDKKLKPAPIEKLTKRQNRALMRGLALERENRIPSVEELWDELRPRKDYTWHFAIGGTAAALLLGALLYGPVQNFIHEREYEAIVAEVESGDERRLVAGLAQIDALPGERMGIAANRARDTIIGYFQDLAEAEVDESEGRYDYPAAFAHLVELERYFEDSAQVAGIIQDFTNRQRDLIANISGRFNELREEGLIMPRDDEEDITDLVAIVRQANPEHLMMSDLELVNAYADLANVAVEAGDWQRADTILSVALDYAPTEAVLLNLDDRVQAELRREAESQLVADLRGVLSGARPGLQSIQDFRGVLDAMRELSELRPDDDIIQALDAPLMRAFEAELGRLKSEARWGDADTLLADFARLFGIGYLVETRDALTRDQVAAGFDPGADAGRVAQLQGHRDAITALLADAEYDDDWNRALEGHFKDMVAHLTPGADWFDGLRQDIAGAHIDSAQELVAANRFSAAGARIDYGERFLPDSPAFGQARSALADAQEAYRIAEEQRRIAAAIERSKVDMLDLAAADRVPEAMQIFDNLRRELPADDPFLVSEAPQAIAEAHRRMSEGAAERGDFGRAAELARAGLEVAPRYQPLLDVVNVYQARERRTQLVDTAGRATTQNMGQIRQSLEQVRTALPNEAGAINREVLAALERRIRALMREDLASARAVREAALQVFPGERQLQGIDIPPDSVYAPRIRAALQDARLTEARELLQRGQQAEPGHPQLAGFEDDIRRRTGQAQGLYDRSQNADTETQRTLVTQAIDIWKDNPVFLETWEGIRPREQGECHGGLAGAGRAVRGQCYDTVAGQRGPTMVVVPGRAGGQPYAIGKYEIAIADYNRYCNATGDCQPLGGDAALPLTGITIQRAEAYIAWLSRESGKSYRLPTDAEWLHAAGGGGDPGPSADYNCRVIQGGRAIKGDSLLRVTTGTDNAWGVRHAVGNAQEWVRAGNRLMARGGAFEDPLTNCSIELTREHGGSADEITGFRVLRELD